MTFFAGGEAADDEGTHLDGDEGNQVSERAELEAEDGWDYEVVQTKNDSKAGRIQGVMDPLEQEFGGNSPSLASMPKFSKE